MYFTQLNKNLPIFDVPEGLNKYATTKKDTKAHIERTPPDSYRNYNEDIYEPITDKGASRQNSVQSTASTEDEDLSGFTSAKANFARDGNTTVSLSDF